MQNHDRILNVMEYSQQVTSLGRFILYGCSPIDMHLGWAFNDIDIAFKGVDWDKIRGLNHRFAEQGFQVVEAGRDYRIQNGRVPVVLVYAKNDQTFLDVCFMEDPSLVGLFNVESLYWRYPQGDCVDRFNALGGLASKKIVPVRTLDSENPLYFLSRYVRLCSKYDISMVGSLEGADFVGSLKNHLRGINYDDYPGPFSSALSSMLKAILQARDRSGFIDELVETGIIHALIPEVGSGLVAADPVALGEAKDRDSLVDVIRLGLGSEESGVLSRKLECLDSRTWEK